MKELPRLNWTPELANRFWSDLAGTEFQWQTAFARFTSQDLVDLAAPHLKNGSRILDFGSGYGLFLVRELLGRGYIVAFFEPSVPEGTRSSYIDGEPNFLGAVNAPVAQAFDAAFCSEVIEHLDDFHLDAALTTLSTSLKQGGTLIVTTPENEDIFSASRYCPTCRHLFHPWGHIRHFSSGDLRALLQQYGFHVDELHSVDFSSNRDPLEELKRLKQILPPFLTDCEEAVKKLANNDFPLGSRLSRHLAELGSYRKPNEPTDPRYRHIGAGGTLVAIAQKIEPR